MKYLLLLTALLATNATAQTPDADAIATRDRELNELILRDDTAVLTGILHQRGTYDGKPFDVRLRVTDTWVRVGGEWKILAGHASVIPEPAEKPAP
jgi:hypothetical protein